MKPPHVHTLVDVDASAFAGCMRCGKLISYGHRCTTCEQHWCGSCRTLERIAENRAREQVATGKRSA